VAAVEGPGERVRDRLLEETALQSWMMFWMMFTMTMVRRSETAEADGDRMVR
jgi:hypothetical protein